MNKSKWLMRVVYLVIWYVIYNGLSLWPLFIFGMGVLGFSMSMFIKIAGTGLLLWSAWKRGLLGNAPASSKNGEAPGETLSQKNARREGYKTAQAAMLADQAELERAEEQIKQQNDVVELVDILKRPGKYSAVEKYRVGFMVENKEEADDAFCLTPADEVDARLTPKKRPIQDIIFYNQNRVRIRGVLTKLTETNIRYFGKAGYEKGGYEMTYCPGVVLTMQFNADGFSEQVYILLPRHPSPSSTNAPDNGYKQATPGIASLDVEIGESLTVTGNLFKRSVESKEGWPAGYYLLAEMSEVKQAAPALAKH